MKQKFSIALSLAVILSMLITSLALADNVQDDVTAGGSDTFTVGGSTTINYWIAANSGDGQSGCNVTDGSPATVTINAPASVTATPSSLTFSLCKVGSNNNSQPVVFTASAAGDYLITVSVSDSGVGGYNTTPANFTLHVQAPPPPSDITAPVTSYTIDGTAGANGWYTSDVTVHWSVTDAQSAVVIDSGCGDQTFTNETTGVTSSCSAHSAGGSASDSITIKIDKTGPTAALAVTAGTAGANGWYTSDVTVSTSGSDSISGPATCTTDQYQTTETTGTQFNGFCTNDAGLTTNAAPLTVKLDKSGPSAVLSASGTAGANGWFIDDVTVSTSGSDSISGSVTCTADQYQTAETAGTAFNGSCTNGAGLTTNATPLTVKLDKTGPSASLSASGTVGNNGWYTSNVTITTSGSDTISNPTTCTADQSQTTDTASATFNGSCTNDAGLSTNAAPLTIKRDATAPTSVSFVGGPAAGGSYYFGSVPAAPTCTADGAISGLASCVVSGYGTTVGTHTMTSKATDNAGNQATATQSYTVLAWTLNGFYQPVDMNGVFNVAKNGSTIPFKFEIFAGSTELTDVADVASFRYGPVACSATAPNDTIETTATGGTSLRYDTVAGQFVYNWKTPTSLGCYSVTMTTLDGSSLTAYFKLK